MAVTAEYSRDSEAPLRCEVSWDWLGHGLQKEPARPPLGPIGPGSTEQLDGAWLCRRSEAPGTRWQVWCL